MLQECVSAALKHDRQTHVALLPLSPKFGRSTHHRNRAPESLEKHLSLALSPLQLGVSGGLCLLGDRQLSAVATLTRSALRLWQLLVPGSLVVSPCEGTLLKGGTSAAPHFLFLARVLYFRSLCPPSPLWAAHVICFLFRSADSQSCCRMVQ